MYRQEKISFKEGNTQTETDSYVVCSYYSDSDSNYDQTLQ